MLPGKRWMAGRWEHSATKSSSLIATILATSSRPPIRSAITLGPTIASAILSVGPWPWLFAVNLPFGIAAIVVGLKTLPDMPRQSHAFDLVGAALATAPLQVGALLPGDLWLWIGPPIAVAYGAAAFALGLRLAGPLLDRRAPDLLATVSAGQ